MASQEIKKAQEFFKKVEEGSREFSSIPDAGLQQKIRKVGESSKQVVEHIEQRSSPKQG